MTVVSVKLAHPFFLTNHTLLKIPTPRKPTHANTHPHLTPRSTARLPHVRAETPAAEFLVSAVCRCALADSRTYLRAGHVRRNACGSWLYRACRYHSRANFAVHIYRWSSCKRQAEASGSSLDRAENRA
jgi:hypothetical protein